MVWFLRETYSTRPYMKKGKLDDGILMIVASVITRMCEAKRSRHNDDMIRVLIDDYNRNGITIPDEAYDRHTQKGKQMGRGVEHFYEEGCKLIDPDGSESEPNEFHHATREIESTPILDFFERLESYKGEKSLLDEE